MTGPMPPPRELPVICCLPHLNQRWQTLELKTSYYTLVKLHQYQLSGCYIVFNKMNLSFFLVKTSRSLFVGAWVGEPQAQRLPRNLRRNFDAEVGSLLPTKYATGSTLGPVATKLRSDEVRTVVVWVVVWVVVSLSVGFGCVCCFWKVVM